MLREYFEQHQADILEFIKWLVEQESMTRVGDATDRLARNLGERLVDLGAGVDFLSDPRYGTSVRGRFSAQRSAADTRQLMVVGHLDTVWPLGTLSNRPFRVEDDRAYGPGIFDMKAGVAVALFSMRAIRELDRQPERDVTVLMTCDEETGSPFSRRLIEEEARRTHAALVLEPPIPGGKIKTGRKGVAEFELTIHGRSAHAGNDPCSGVSALTELAHQILVINSMNDYQRGTTLNVGVARGGILPNVIPSEAHASIDVRFQTAEEGTRIAEKMANLRPVVQDATLEVRGGINRPPMQRTAEVGALFEHARGVAAEIGFVLQEGSVGGGSDGNFIAALGVPVLDGLGVDGAGAHAEHEHIIINDIARCAAFLTRLIETI